MKQVLILAIVLIIGFAGIFALSRNLENLKVKPDPSRGDEDLYFSPAQLAAVSHDFRGLIADWYWINSLQYVGGKLVENEGKVNINDLRPLNPHLLYPMLDTASTLDPKFTTIYTYGASVLPAVDNEQAIKLVRKGIVENPDNWHLYHNLGYIYWQMKDYANAAEAYTQGSNKPDAPAFMKQMSVNMLAQGRSLEFAVQVYEQMYKTAEDEQTRNFAELRYNKAVSDIEVEAINKVLEEFTQKTGRCPNNWREISGILQKNENLRFDSAIFSPVDPTGVPYLLLNTTECKVTIDGQISKIPMR